MSRGLSNRNPGNIRQSAVRYKGEVRPSRDPAFKQFESMPWGVSGDLRPLGHLSHPPRSGDHPRHDLALGPAFGEPYGNLHPRSRRRRGHCRRPSGRHPRPDDDAPHGGGHFTGGKRHGGRYGRCGAGLGVISSIAAESPARSGGGMKSFYPNSIQNSPILLYLQV